MVWAAPVLMMCEAQQETSTGATYKVQDSGHMVQGMHCTICTENFCTVNKAAQIGLLCRCSVLRAVFKLLPYNYVLLSKISQFATYLTQFGAPSLI